MPKPITHPIHHDMHYGAPKGCSAHRKCSIGDFRDPEVKDASDVLQMLLGAHANHSKLLSYVGCAKGIHRYFYSYDSYTLGVIEFKEEPQLTSDPDQSIHKFAQGN